MTDKFRFAATYPVYGHMKVSFDGDLVELVSDCLWAEELGEQGSTSYWEWTGAEWSPIDVSEHVRLQLRSWLDGLAVGTEVER